MCAPIAVCGIESQAVNERIGLEIWKNVVK